jgi:hypothetical protein
MNFSKIWEKNTVKKKKESDFFNFFMSTLKIILFKKKKKKKKKVSYQLPSPITLKYFDFSSKTVLD